MRGHEGRLWRIRSLAITSARPLVPLMSSDSHGDPSLRFLSILLLAAGSVAASTICLAYAGLPLPDDVQPPAENKPESRAEPDQKNAFTEYIDRLLEED